LLYAGTTNGIDIINGVDIADDGKIAYFIGYFLSIGYAADTIDGDMILVRFNIETMLNEREILFS
jgi:hypothetical protein